MWSSWEEQRRWCWSVQNRVRRWMNNRNWRTYVRMGRRSWWVGCVGVWVGGISMSWIFGRGRGWAGVRNLYRIRNLHGNLNVLLAHILHSCMTLFLIKGLFHELVVCVALLLFRWSALFFGDVSVSHIATLVDQGLATFNNFRFVSRDRHGVAFDFHGLFTLFSCSRLKSSCLAFFQIV